MNTKSKRTQGRFFFRYVLPSLIVFSVLFYVFFLRDFFETMKESNTVAKARDLGLSFYEYAHEHNEQYPEGKSSTEIFQKLLDGGYLGTESGKASDVLDLLYYPMPGKVKAEPGTKVLKPENICWDVTCCTDAQSPDLLPVIFLTGYKVTYQAGASTVPLSHPLRSWLDWWHGKDYPTFIVIGYRRDGSRGFTVSPDGSIPNFIPADFDPKGKVYRQLTPDGVLSP